MAVDNPLGKFGSQQHQVNLQEQSLKFDLVVNGDDVLVGLNLDEARTLASNILNVLDTNYATETVLITEDGAGGIMLRRCRHSANIAVDFQAVVLRKENGSLLIAQELDGHWYRGMVPVAITRPCLPDRAYSPSFVDSQLMQLKDDWKP